MSLDDLVTRLFGLVIYFRNNYFIVFLIAMVIIEGAKYIFGGASEKDKEGFIDKIKRMIFASILVFLAPEIIQLIIALLSYVFNTEIKINQEILNQWGIKINDIQLFKNIKP